jgi:lipoprotein-releasing system ATP-binding protein
MDKKVIIETQGLDKYFYEPVKFKALKSINLKIYEGEFMTLIGKSGSGKSTLLYCLSTMDTAYDGNLWIDNENLKNKSIDDLARLRSEKIGFVFQFHYLLPEFTVLKNVMIPAMKLKQYSDTVIEKKAKEKLEFLGLGDQMHKMASKLSGGQQQRVSIARALINDPKILMCDEPTGNLDSKNTALVFDMFKHISSELGQTIVTVTHDSDFARKSDRTIELADGEVLN